MSEDIGAVAAPETAVVTPELAPAPEPTRSEPSKSTGEALERAFERAGVKDEFRPAEKPEPVSEGQPRGPDGKFVAKDAVDGDAPKPEAELPEAPKPEAKPEPKFDVPSRFSADAKAAWEQVPLPVKAEIGRAFKELETGIQQYREQVEPLKPFMDLAAQHNTTVPEALSRYIGIEQELAKDPIRGLDLIARNMGTDLKAIAAQVMGQPAPEKDQVIEGLRAEIAALKNQVGGVTGTLQQQHQRTVTQMVQDFATANPRFDELSGEIARMLKTGYASDLKDAYEKADRLNPAPQPAPQAQTPPPPSAHPGKAALSVQGAPGSGSNPAARQRSGSTDEAARRAFAQVGLL